MALDHTHPGGPALAKVYLDIMHRDAAAPHPAVPPAPAAPLVAAAPPAEPRDDPVVMFDQLQWVLDNMWGNYDQFVVHCHRAFKIRRVKGEPRGLDIRKRFSIRTWKHRGLGAVAARAVDDLRASLSAAEESLRSRCYVPHTSPVFYYNRPPTIPSGCTFNLTPLNREEKQLIAKHLQLFRDQMSTAGQHVDAYIAVLVSDANKRQVWFDNFIKLVTAVTALGSALAPI